MKTVYIILAFCAGLFLGHLLIPTIKETKEPVYVQLEHAKKKLATIDQGFTSGSAVFEKRNDSLEKELKGYKFLLSAARSRLEGKRKVTSILLDRIKADALVRCDSSLLDSLSYQVASVAQSTDSLISRYEQKDSLQEQMLANKDSQLLLCNNSYQQLRDLAQEQMLQQQQLTESLNTALKAQKRKRVQNRFLAAGIVFVSGITTTLYIKSKQ